MSCCWPSERPDPDVGRRAGARDAAPRRPSARRAGAPEQLAHAAVLYGGRFVWPRAISDVHLLPLLEEALAALGEGDSVLKAKLLGRLTTARRATGRESAGWRWVTRRSRWRDGSATTYARPSRWTHRSRGLGVWGRRGREANVAN